MTKNNKNFFKNITMTILFLLVPLIILGGFVFYAFFPKKTFEPFDSSFIPKTGIYAWDTVDAEKASSVDISNGSEKEISFSIDTYHAGGYGKLEGVASRVGVGARLYQVTLPSKNNPSLVCFVGISFGEQSEALSYSALGKGCDDFLEKNGKFFNGVPHHLKKSK